MSLSNASFEFVRTLLRERSGHYLEADKVYLVETRLLPLTRRYGCASVEELVSRLRGRRNEKLLTELVEAMAINETFFFRDTRSFEILRQTILPELMRRRADVRCLNIWSAACSSGQEAYSVALLLRHYFPGLPGWSIRLLGSDLSAVALERARQGRYSELEVSRGLPDEILEVYFQRQGDGWQIADDIRRMVEFLPINLNGVWPEFAPLDLVLLRNVLIYFDLPTKQQILNRVHRVLHPDGYLMLGGAETTHNLHVDFVPISFEQVSFFRVRNSQDG
jgi:chemotaxis protein methyltransferase CheR